MGKSRRRRRRPVLIAAGVAVALAAGGAGAYAVRRTVMEGQACESVQAQVAETGPIRTVAEGDRNVVVLGDSYSVGDGLADRSKAWPAILGESERWNVQVAGVGGTGFLNEGPCGGQSFGQRLHEVITAKPQTLIIEGGLNDAGSAPDEVRAAASAVLLLTASVPRVVVVGPANAPAKQNLPAIDQALAAAAKAHGREYVSALAWELAYLPDRMHPTEAGHKAYAARLTSALGKAQRP